jgi:hypothetical protein
MQQPTIHLRATHPQHQTRIRSHHWHYDTPENRKTRPPDYSHTNNYISYHTINMVHSSLNKPQTYKTPTTQPTRNEITYIPTHELWHTGNTISPNLSSLTLMAFLNPPQPQPPLATPTLVTKTCMKLRNPTSRITPSVASAYRIVYIRHISHHINQPPHTIGPTNAQHRITK